MLVTLSIVNNRWQCARALRRTATSKDFGLITNVKLQRIGFMVWHLQYDVEAKLG